MIAPSSRICGRMSKKRGREGGGRADRDSVEAGGSKQARQSMVPKRKGKR